MKRWIVRGLGLAGLAACLGAWTIVPSSLPPPRRALGFGFVYSLAFSPDGRYLWVGGSGGPQALEVGTWMPADAFPLAPIWTAYELKLSPCSRFFCAAQFQGQLTITTVWDREGRARVAQLLGRLLDVAGSSPGTLRVALMEQRHVEVWEVAGPRRRRVLKVGPEGPTIPAHAVLSADGRLLAVSYFNTERLKLPEEEMLRFAEPDQVTVWDLQEGRRVATLALPHLKTEALAISPDGRFVACGSWYGELHLWEVATGERVRTWRSSDPKRSEASPECLAFAPDARLLAIGWNDAVELWETESGVPYRTLIVPTKKTMILNSIAFSPDGRFLAWGGTGALFVWDVPLGEVTYAFVGSGFWAVVKMEFSPDGRYLAVTTEDGAVVLWDVPSGVVVRRLEGHEGLQYLAFHPEGRILAVGSYKKGVVRFWDIETGGLHRVFLQDGHVRALAFSPDGRGLAVASERTLGLWDVESGELRWAYEGSHRITAVAFSPDGRFVAFGQDDGAVHLLNSEGQWVRAFPNASFWIRRLAFSPDGGIIFIATAYTVEAREVQTGRLRLSISSFFPGIMGMAVSPGPEPWLALGGGVLSSHLMVMNWAAGPRLRTPEPFVGTINAIRFCPKGRWLAVGLEPGGHVWLWAVEDLR
ncbi:MAG: WD40 repeat domain-containing protein [Candidatus Bipolaricaulota bacterium]|nr:WD40 repeat domain-containing protein [Candidatus Bipolaricaulota bacterium]MDW8152465.1 WD40 repeat domain-containing protein [Candidatus Bipolaricaulota bacterium]